MNIRSFTIKLVGIVLTLGTLTQSGFAYNKAALTYLKANKKVQGPNPGHLDFSLANLSGINLSNADLRGANFCGADLTGANLSGANFSNTTLRGNFSRANFNGANLSGATLHGDMSYANFNYANLYKAKLQHVSIIGATFREADLSGVDFFCSDIRNVDFSNTNLTFASFLGVKKTGDPRYLNVSDWNSVNFNGADIGGAYFHGCQISNEDLIKKGALNVEKTTR